MKVLAQTALIVIALFVFQSLQKTQAQNAPYTPKDAKLYQTILHMDSVMFDAFNQHNLTVLEKMFAENLEFYNDGGGVSDYKTTIENFKQMFARNQGNGLRRELIKESLQVYPVPGFGAIEITSHRFIHTENGKEEIGTQKIIQTWQYKDGEWKATRIISLGH
jgi:hypothetical protein